MVMAEYYIQDVLQELWQQINQLHLTYLDTEDSPQKIDQRIKLEACIKEYLCLAPHNRKFCCPETVEVLHRSASSKKDFSGYRAALGWNAISMYAGNLLSQSWRKEYRTIKTYCGFYKHQIEANLVGAEAMFEAMGYKHVGDGILTLEGPVCPDRVKNVSQDSIVAFVECQILKTIWEEVSNNFKVSWLDVLIFRETHLCSPEQSIRMLNYGFQERRYHEENNTYTSQPTENYTIPRYSHIVSHTPIPTMHSFLPAPTHYIPITTHPGQCVYANPYYNYSTYAPVPPNHFPRYGTVPYSVPVTCPPKQGCNGYCYPNGCVSASSYYPVPTGQLIELDPQNGMYDTPDGIIKNRQPDYFEPHKQLAKSTNLDSLTLSKSREDGAGTFESWDYVYRNLESQGYNKDLGERGDVLQRRTNKKTKPSIELEDAFNNLNVSDERNLKVNEALKKFKDIKIKPERPVAQSSSYDNIIMQNDKTLKSVSNGFSKITKNQKPANVTLDTKKLRRQDVDKIKQKMNKKDDGWNCNACTYLNDISVEICIMCGKSKKTVNDTMAVGGSECPACTLVNPKEVKMCEACGTSLIDSPTYI